MTALTLDLQRYEVFDRGSVALQNRSTWMNTITMIRLARSVDRTIADSGADNLAHHPAHNLAHHFNLAQM